MNVTILGKRFNSHRGYKGLCRQKMDRTPKIFWRRFWCINYI